MGNLCRIPVLVFSLRFHGVVIPHSAFRTCLPGAQIHIRRRDYPVTFRGAQVTTK